MKPGQRAYLQKGVVIPALPLALDEDKRIDEKYQRALLRYYSAAGAGGVAAAVHTTQFEIRESAFGLFKPLLRFVAEVLNEIEAERHSPLLRIAGVCGKRDQATAEAEYAASLGYDAALLSLGSLRQSSIDELIIHCRTISEIIPLMGFYLQPAVGGLVLPYEFWYRFFEIENVVAVKIAPFNRYRTIDVVRALGSVGREDEIALYTGNDDSIILDLLTPFPVRAESGSKTIRIKGGLLGQWSVWTYAAVRLLDRIQRTTETDNPEVMDLLMMNAALTDANGAIFDVRNSFKGCIAGIHEILFRQGLMRFTHCLNPREILSSGQQQEIERVIKAYSWLTDDEFIAQHLHEWLQ
jgi:dihydrodipicolinate synthase/N-acetylneuraminate lyase